MVKLVVYPKAFASLLKILEQREWKVLIQTGAPIFPKSFSTLVLISCAALLVKVTARIFEGYSVLRCDIWCIAARHDSHWVLGRYHDHLLFGVREQYQASHVFPRYTRSIVVFLTNQDIFDFVVFLFLDLDSWIGILQKLFNCYPKFRRHDFPRSFEKATRFKMRKLFEWNWAGAERKI